MVNASKQGLTIFGTVCVTLALMCSIEGSLRAVLLTIIPPAM